MSVATKPVVRLVGQDGNAFAIISACMKAARQAGWSAEQRSAVQQEMMAGNYDHLLQTALKHFEVR